MRSLIFLLFLCACSLPGRVAHQDEALLRGIQAWIAANSEYEETETLPIIRLVSQNTIDRAIGAEVRPVALYYHPRKEIWLREDFDADNPEDLIVLVHEMVHHMQQGHEFPCRTEMEPEAYRLMDKYAVEIIGDVTLTRGMANYSWSCPVSAGKAAPAISRYS